MLSATETASRRHQEMEIIATQLMNSTVFDSVMQKIQLLNCFPLTLTYRKNLKALNNTENAAEKELLLEKFKLGITEFWQTIDPLFSEFLCVYPNHTEETLSALTRLSLLLLQDDGIFLTAYHARTLTNGGSLFSYFYDKKAPATLLAELNDCLNTFSKIENDFANYNNPRTYHHSLTDKPNPIEHFRKLKSGLCTNRPNPMTSKNLNSSLPSSKTPLNHSLN